MVIDSKVECGLPALAWLVECDGAGEIHALCGKSVEVSEHGLFEGCWAGDFAAYDFDRVTYVFGSGVRMRDGKPIFVPPSHTLDALYIWNRSDGYCVSNSLAFLCEYCAIDLPYAGYGRRFASVVLGIEKYEKEIHRDAHGTLLRIVYDHFSIEDGALRVARPATACPFSDFVTYRAHLLDTIRRTAENGDHPDRQQSYDVLATCSTGYDSATGAALAFEIGCREAITFGTDRAGNVDSGREIAERLGMECIELPGHGHDWAPAALTEVEFCSTGLGGEDVVFSQADHLLSHRLLITGFHGDSVWSLDKHAVTSIERGDLSGSSLSEFRLRLGFVHLPLPFIGCRNWPQIQRINRSTEMSPYRIGGKYDRPLPRRILEEAGVDRALFGQQKKAVSTLLFSDRMRLSRESLRDFLEHEPAIVADRRLFFYFRSIQFLGQRIANKLAREFFARLLGLHTWYRRMESMLINDYRVFEHTHPRTGDAVLLWALQKQKQAYRASSRTSV